METETLNIRVATELAEFLMSRAQAVGMSRQEFVDLVLRREVLYSSDAWGCKHQELPGFREEFAELAATAKSKQRFAFIFRDLQGAATILVGAVEYVTPLTLWIRPDGDRTFPIPRATLIAWQEFRMSSGDLWEIVLGWCHAGARLHPNNPSDWATEVNQAMSGRRRR